MLHFRSFSFAIETILIIIILGILIIPYYILIIPSPKKGNNFVKDTVLFLKYKLCFCELFCKSKPFFLICKGIFENVICNSGFRCHYRRSYLIIYLIVKYNIMYSTTFK